MKIINPATGAIIADVAADNAAAARRKYEVARAGQVRWAKLPIRRRLEAIAKFRERIVAMHETLARTLTHEVGKPIRQSRNELNGLLGRIDFFIAESHARCATRRSSPTPGRSSRSGSRTSRWAWSPHISAWNYPYFVGSNVFVPALVAGNAVLYKPSRSDGLPGSGTNVTRKRAPCPHASVSPTALISPTMSKRSAGPAVILA